MACYVTTGSYKVYMFKISSDWMARLIEWLVSYQLRLATRVLEFIFFQVSIDWICFESTFQVNNIPLFNILGKLWLNDSTQWLSTFQVNFDSMTRHVATNNLLKWFVQARLRTPQAVLEYWWMAIRGLILYDQDPELRIHYYLLLSNLRH